MLVWVIQGRLWAKEEGTTTTRLPSSDSMGSMGGMDALNRMGSWDTSPSMLQIFGMGVQAVSQS